MERQTYEKDQVIFKPNQKIDRLLVIQSGVVQLSVPYDKRLRNKRFVIERLTSGAVLNHQSFLLEQKAEAEYVCSTQVSCYELSHSRFQQIMQNRDDLQKACQHLDEEVFKKQKSIALDYVLHNNEANFASLQQYQEQLFKNEYKVRLKNAIMQVWSQVKIDGQPKNLKTIMRERREAKRKQEERLGTYINEEQQEKTEDELIEVDSKTSYFTCDQYDVLKKRIDDANYRLKEQQSVVDRLELTTSKLNQAFKEK